MRLAEPRVEAILASAFMGCAYTFGSSPTDWSGVIVVKKLRWFAAMMALSASALSAASCTRVIPSLAFSGLVGRMGRLEVLGDADAAGTGHLGCDLFRQHGLPDVAGRAGAEKRARLLRHHLLDEIGERHRLETLVGMRRLVGTALGRPRRRGRAQPIQHFARIHGGRLRPPAGRPPSGRR